MQALFFAAIITPLIAACIYQFYLNIKTVAEDEERAKYESYKRKLAAACNEYCKDKCTVTVELSGSGWDNEGKLI